MIEPCFSSFRLFQKGHCLTMFSSHGSPALREYAWGCEREVVGIGKKSTLLGWLYYIIPSSEKAMALHSSTLAWKIPWMEEPGGLQSMGSRRVGHDWATSLSLFTLMHWSRKRQRTPVFLPGESQGQRSLVGCRLWGRTESDTTEAAAEAAAADPLHPRGNQIILPLHFEETF